MPGGPKWCEQFLILYRTPYSTKLKVDKTDVVSVCLFGVYFRADYPKPRHCCKCTFGCFVSSRIFMCCDFSTMNGSSQPTTAAAAILNLFSIMTL